MNKQDLAILAKAWAVEIDRAMSGVDIPPMIQGRSKRLLALVDRGYLDPIEHRMGGSLPCLIRGFVLSHKGRQAYCESCK